MPAAPASSDLRDQVIFLQGPGNESIPLPLPMVDETMRVLTSVSINYGSQIGACIVMLAMVATMTGRSRFMRLSTIISVVALVLCIVRCTLLALYFTSSYVEFYTFYSADAQYINPASTRNSVAASVLAVPQLVLIEAALIAQAYSMIRLWPSVWRGLAVAVSLLVAVCAVAFKCASTALQVQATLDYAIPEAAVWLHQCDLAFTTTTIFWFCFVFIFRLIAHMWEYRTVLPSFSGLSAMEVLIITNGLLMLVPVIFACIEYANFAYFEAASLVETSVVIVLPLGTLIAQHVTLTGSSRATSARNGQGGTSKGSSGYSGSTGVASKGTYSQTTMSDTTSDKKHLFGTWTQSSDSTSTALLPGGSLTTQVVSMHSGDGSAAARSPGSKHMDAIDKQLERIDSECGGSPGRADGVWVGHKFDVRHDAV